MQLEKALAADKRMTQWKNQVSNPESEGELSESLSARIRSARGTARLAAKALKKRNRSGTASSATTHTDDGTLSSSTAYQRQLLKTSKDNRSITPTEIRSSSETSRDVVPPRRIPSNVSLRATKPASRPESPPIPISPSEIAATTSGRNTGVSVTTDDEETDFQSAYSASPRESYADYDGAKGDEDDTVVVNKDKIDGQKKRQSTSTLAKLQRERVSSTATAVQRHDFAQPSPTFSEDTVVSQRIIIEA